jgi:AraC-like DNA-binding protein
MNTPFDFPRTSVTERPWWPQISAPSRFVKHTGGLARWQMKRVREHIEMNIALPLATDEVARVVNLSVSHFCRAFKHSFGITVHRYVMHKRIERAQELIASTSDPLSDIAVSCGMSDQSHLTRWFRRVVGETPGRWRTAFRDRTVGVEEA